MLKNRKNKKEIEENQSCYANYFEQIDFNKLPNSFVIKCNHGCKWQYIIKDKNLFLSNKHLIDIVKQSMTGYLEQEYWCWNGFEMQYKSISNNNCGYQTQISDIAVQKKQTQRKGIEPKILIEELLREEINTNPKGINVYCFNGEPKLLLEMENGEFEFISLYDENLNCLDDTFSESDNKLIKQADECTKLCCELSKKLSKDFYFVRVDWIIYKNKAYFEELTFTPYSGFLKINKSVYKRLNKFMDIKRY